MSSTFDDNDFPAYTMGRAAEMIGATPAFLRSLGAAGLIEAERSHGGHRRYSRHQLRLAARVRQLLDEGLPMNAACRIVALEDRLAAAHRHIVALGGRPTAAEDAELPTATRPAAEEAGLPAATRPSVEAAELPTATRPSVEGAGLPATQSSAADAGLPSAARPAAENAEPPIRTLPVAGDAEVPAGTRHAVA